MKNKLFLTGTGILLVSLATFALAGENGSWTGWISDENCATNYDKSAKPDHAGCVKACVANGGKWALATKNGHFILKVEGTEATNHVGHEVTVKGKLDKESNIIKVSSIS